MERIPRLRVPLTDAERAINHAAQTGNDFHFADWTGAGSSETAERLNKWYAEVSDTLDGIFSTDEMAKQFMAVSHGIAGIDKEDRRYKPVVETFAHRLAWLRRLHENLGIYVAQETSAKKADVEFEKVTVMWLLHHLPVRLWIGGGASLIAVFILGVTLGQTTFIQEMTGKTRPIMPTPTPALSSEEVKAKVDELTKGHNERLKTLTDGMVDLNKKFDYSVDSSKVRVAIEDVKKEIDNEYLKYQDVRALSQGIEPTK